MANVYLDSCMIIGLIEGDAIQQQTLKKQLAKHSIYSSELARLEARLLAIRNEDQDSLQKFDQFFACCEMVALTREVFDRASLLRAKNLLKTPDALHLAAAIHAGCSEFWTDDKQLKVAASNFVSAVDWAALVAME